jgi:hypothetical protein
MKLRLLALSCVLFSLTSCLDIIETFNLNENGGGTYETKMDMSKMMSMIAMMGAGQAGSEKIPEKMDSSLSFKEYADTATGLSADERRVLRNGTVKVHLNKEEGEMYMIINMPFSNAADYAVINKAMSKMGGQPMEGAFKGIFGSGMGDNPLGDMSDDGSVTKKDNKGGLPSANFETSLTGNQLSRKVKPQPKSDATKVSADDKDMPAELKEMFKVSYTTVVNLPRPVKKLAGTDGKVSEDKKQVRFSKKIDFSDGFTAKDFDFTIDF